MELRNIVIASVLAITMNACASTTQNPVEANKLATSCDKNLDVAYKELDFARANGLGGSWEYTKAASILGAAKVQSGFGAYEGCVEKVKTARGYIKESKQ